MMIPDSSEFARLVTAWIEETATADEAAQLWRAIAESPECALEFAAAMRFESLLAATVKQRLVETAALTDLGGVMAPDSTAAKKSGVIGGSKQRVALQIAAVVAVLGIAAWLMSPTVDASKSSPEGRAKIASKPKPVLEGAADVPLGIGVRPLAEVTKPAKSPATETDQRPFTERLDAFFLGGVSLNQVPLREALGILQGLVQELNFRNDGDLAKLRVTVPSAAAGRRVTFHSGSIAFLKAVRAVAALGGTDVTVDGTTITLTLQRGIFPQVPERRDLMSLLAGRVTVNGTVAANDAVRVQALINDAAALGIAVDPSLPLDQQDLPPITRGQWDALVALTDSRAQLDLYPVPNFEIYVSETTSTEATRLVDPPEMDQLRRDLEPTATVPATMDIGAPQALVTDVTEIPATAPATAVVPASEATSAVADQGGFSGGIGNGNDQSAIVPTITMQPLGNAMQVNLWWPGIVAAANANQPQPARSGPVTAVVFPGQGIHTVVQLPHLQILERGAVRAQSANEIARNFKVVIGGVSMGTSMSMPVAGGQRNSNP